MNQGQDPSQHLSCDAFCLVTESASAIANNFSAEVQSVAAAHLLVTDKTHSGQIHVHIINRSVFSDLVPRNFFPAARSTNIEKQLWL